MHLRRSLALRLALLGHDFFALLHHLVHELFALAAFLALAFCFNIFLRFFEFSEWIWFCHDFLLG